MQGLLLGLALSPSEIYQDNPALTQNWILAFSVWDDSGYWLDNESWLD